MNVARGLQVLPSSPSRTIGIGPGACPSRDDQVVVGNGTRQVELVKTEDTSWLAGAIRSGAGALFTRLNPAGKLELCFQRYDEAVSGTARVIATEP